MNCLVVRHVHGYVLYFLYRPAAPGTRWYRTSVPVYQVFCMSKQCCTRRFWDVPGNSWYRSLLRGSWWEIEIYDSSSRLWRVKTTKSATTETSEARANARVRPGFSSAGLGATCLEFEMIYD